MTTTKAKIASKKTYFKFKMFDYLIVTKIVKSTQKFIIFQENQVIIKLKKIKKQTKNKTTKTSIIYQLNIQKKILYF